MSELSKSCEVSFDSALNENVCAEPFVKNDLVSSDIFPSEMKLSCYKICVIENLARAVSLLAER